MTWSEPLIAPDRHRPAQHREVAVDPARFRNPG